MKSKLFTLVCLKFLIPVTVWAQGFSDFQSGDMIFQRSRSSQSMAIFAATKSPYTHVGIVEVDSKGRRWVIEAVGPVRRISLDRWLKQGVDSKFALHRKSGLSEEQKNKIVSSAMKYEGRPYDKLFTYKDNGKAIYCSELVEMAYRDAGLKVGTQQSLNDLDADDGFVNKLIGDRWAQHPSCKGVARSQSQCKSIILDELMITPKGLTLDSGVEKLHSDFGITDGWMAVRLQQAVRRARR